MFPSLAHRLASRVLDITCFGLLVCLMTTGIITETFAQQGSQAVAKKPIRVAIYDHSDGSASGPKNLTRILTPKSGFDAVVVSPQEIREGVLKGFEVLIMPGGSGSKQSEMLSDEGREVVKSFVKDGGGYVGVCAGSYLASSQYSWSLGLINARVWDRSHWARGTGNVCLEFSSAGCDVLKHTHEEIDVYYGQGPLLVPDNDPNLPGYEVLASYKTEIAKKGAPEGAMEGTHAIIRTLYGEGRVICFSPHPEKSGGPNSIMVEGVRWAGSNRME